MGIALMFLLALYQMQSAIHSEIIESPVFNENALQQPEEVRPVAEGVAELLDSEQSEQPEQTELEFRYPISAIGIDYAKNSVVLRFQKHPRKQRYKYDPDYELKRKSMQDNFMHFGKRQPEQLPAATGAGYYEAPLKRSAMDRYGRDPKQDFMRFGRAPADFMRFGRDPKQDFMRFGRDPKQDFMRFGRDPKQDFMRFGRDPKQDFMRFGRAPSDFMRFGRDPKQDFMRFGRADNFMRFGRNLQFHEELRSPKQDFMRFGRPDNFMRFGRSAPSGFERYGKLDANFMRFGKSLPAGSSEVNQTKAQDKLQAVAGGQQGEHSNPVDKALNGLFNKQQEGQEEGQEPQQEQQHQQQSQEESQLKGS
ncbi:hypothetical protein KR222_011873, partial [Zaprionus bogoriensis]